MNAQLRVVVLVALLAGGCVRPPPGSTTDAGVCTASLPESCPSPLPSYATDVAPIIQAACISCHGTTQPSYSPLTSYAEVASQRLSIIDQLLVCQMPPAPAKLTMADQQTLLTWLACGAPNN